MHTDLMTAEERAYIDAVAERLQDAPETLARWTTGVCPECGTRPGPTEPDPDRFAEHAMIRETVVIGCEGYWVINPNAVGIDSPNWHDWNLPTD